MPTLEVYNIFRWNIHLPSIIAIHQGIDECTVHFLQGATIVIYRTHRVSISDPDTGWVTYEPEAFKVATTKLIEVWKEYNASANSQTENKDMG